MLVVVETEAPERLLRVVLEALPGRLVVEPRLFASDLPEDTIVTVMHMLSLPLEPTPAE